MTVDPELRDRQQATVRAWTAFVEHGDALADAVRPEILASWQRAPREVPLIGQAPLADEGETRDVWQESALRRALERVEPDLRRTAEDGDLVIAVTDERTRILWTYGGRVMRRKAEAVNFVAGGRWDEASVGVNALNLAQQQDAPSMVFSAEHHASIVHNWVCWAAPVHDPVTGRRLGVIDLSTVWERTHPIGLATARMMARLIETAMPATGVAAQPVASSDAGLRLTLLGTAEALVDGQRLLLNRRQTEVLALLALAPRGLSLEELHAQLYGDQAVTTSTLKAEVSHLRASLGGRLASRPYRLTMDVVTDVDTVLQRLRSGDVAGAVAAYGGDLMPGTNSPRLAELADYVAVAVREALLADPQPDAVIRFSELAPYDTEVLEQCLRRLEDAGWADPTVPLLKARLAVAERS